MKGQLLIDELDMYTKHGISIIKGSYNNLVAFPTLKDPEKNDWPEEDGQEFDLSVVALDTSEISIEFGFRDDLGFGGLIAIWDTIISVFRFLVKHIVYVCYHRIAIQFILDLK